MRKMTFDNLVTGEFNRFAYSAATAILERSMMINPLLVQAETGLGKTHLLHAILNKAIEKRSHKKHILVTSERFVNEFITAIKQNNLESFKQKYRNIQLLVIDDIQFLSKKSATQAELSLIFDYLQDHDVQIVLSADCPIDEISGISTRLKSRFECGVIVVIQKPDFTDRKEIIRSWLLEENMILSDEVIDIIAQEITSNIRDLEGALTQVTAYQVLCNADIDVETARKVLNIGNEKDL